MVFDARFDKLSGTAPFDKLRVTQGEGAGAA